MMNLLKIKFLLLFLSINFLNSQSTSLPLLYNDNPNKVIFGTLEVPMDHYKKQSKKISIVYAVLKTTNPKPGFPLLYISGGPGAPTINETTIDNWRRSVFINDRDIILFDQRGMGKSTELPNIGKQLFEVMAMDLDLMNEQKKFKGIIKNYKQKIKNGQLELSNFNSFQSAKDVYLLMKHLNYPKYHLYGVSYGTRLSRIIQDLFPESIKSVILDSPSLLDDNFIVTRLDGYESSFNKLINFCTSDSICNSNFPNLHKTYLKTMVKLEKEPIEIQMENGYIYYLNAQDANYFIRRSLYSLNSKESTPTLIKHLNNRNTGQLANVIKQEESAFNFLNMSSFLSFEAYDVFTPLIRQKQLNKLYSKHPLIANKLGFFSSLYLNGKFWHRSRIHKANRNFKLSSVPTLVFVNEYDPATPPKNGKRILEKLSQGHLFIINAEGHGATFNKCSQNIINDFFTDSTIKLNTSCLELMHE